MNIHWSCGICTPPKFNDRICTIQTTWYQKNLASFSLKFFDSSLVWMSSFDFRSNVNSKDTSWDQRLIQESNWQTETVEKYRKETFKCIAFTEEEIWRVHRIIKYIEENALQNIGTECNELCDACICGRLQFCVDLHRVFCANSRRRILHTDTTRRGQRRTLHDLPAHVVHRLTYTYTFLLFDLMFFSLFWSRWCSSLEPQPCIGVRLLRCYFIGFLCLRQCGIRNVTKN